MEEYINEAEEVTLDDDLRQSYDKEWAMKDLGIQEGYESGKEQNTKELAIKMLKEKIDINIISKITNLSKEELKTLRQ